jgi:glycosyltransferase involved in cell wall biosynthesis
VSGPPFSQFLLALSTQLHPRTAVVLDYRDEWSTYRSSYEMMSPWADRVGAILEDLVLRCADCVTTATEPFRDALLARFSFLSSNRVHAICNGYDPSDFPSSLAEPTGDVFTLTYAGTIFRLTSARGLLAGVKLLHERSPHLAKKLRVRFIGRIVDTEADAFEGMDALGVERIGYMDHERVLDELARSHAVLCILDDVPGAERIYPGKIFELMYLGRPALVLAPRGALAELVQRHRLGRIVAPRDASAIADLLAGWLQEFDRGEYRPRARSVGVDQYDRRVLAGRFADVFRQAVEVRRASIFSQNQSRQSMFSPSGAGK